MKCLQVVVVMFCYSGHSNSLLNLIYVGMHVDITAQAPRYKI